MNHLAAELLISTSDFPEHALPRMCLDCSFRRSRRLPSRPGLLSHQIVICKHSSPCSQGTPSERRGAFVLKKGACVLKKQPLTSVYSQKQPVKQQGMGLQARSSPASARDAQSQGTKHGSRLQAAHRYHHQAASSPQGDLNSRNKVLFTREIITTDLLN